MLHDVDHLFIPNCKWNTKTHCVQRFPQNSPTLSLSLAPFLLRRSWRDTFREVTAHSSLAPEHPTLTFLTKSLFDLGHSKGLHHLCPVHVTNPLVSHVPQSLCHTGKTPGAFTFDVSGTAALMWTCCATSAGAGTLTVRQEARDKQLLCFAVICLMPLYRLHSNERTGITACVTAAAEYNHLVQIEIRTELDLAAGPLTVHSQTGTCPGRQWRPAALYRPDWSEHRQEKSLD